MNKKIIKIGTEKIINKIKILPEKDASFSQRENNTFHTSYAFEKVIRNCFKMGDIEGYNKALEAMYSGQQKLIIGNVSKDKLQQLKYACVTFGALVTRAAIEGGLLEMDAYEYSDRFLREIDCAKTIGGISNAFDVLHEVICAVRDIKIKNTNNIKIRKCQNYIHDHLHNKITREDLINVSGLTPSYLSAIFKKETGKTISEYIIEEKINEARRLIDKGELSLSTIGYTLGFCSQSHFSASFKKLVGVTPKEYQQSYQ